MFPRFYYFCAALVVALLAGCSTMGGGPGSAQSAASQGKTSNLARRAASVLENQMNLPSNKRIPQDLVSDAKCIAVFPRIIKAGFIIGGRRGTGLVSCRQSSGDFKQAAPAVFTLTGGSIGLSAGAQKSSVILLFETRDSMDSLLENNLKLGSDIGITAGPLGFNADIKTAPSPVVSYVASKTGLFAGVNLNGTKLSYSQKANSRIYTSNVQGPRSILLQTNQIPPSMAPFSRTLQTYVQPNS